MPRGPGKLQRKILVLLLGGASLSCASFSPRAYFKTLRELDREFEKFDREQLLRSINAAYRSKLIDYRERSNGEVTVVLNKKGKREAHTYTLATMKVKKPAQWDKQWRIIIFDIPHSIRKARDAFRFHLKRLGFVQLQKSVFVIPFPCEKEIDFLTEVYDVRPFVRQILAHRIDTELELKTIFDLS